MSVRPVPVVVVAGYLGAGKSTLLNHLLSGAGDARIGVVVNDFGAVNIDAMLVSGASGGGAVRTVSLSNGCVCCTVDDDELEDVLGAPAARDLDLVVVEASGLAEPAAMVRRVVLAQDPRIDYGGLVYVADAAHLVGTMERHPSLRHHLALADLVVLNKIDLAADPGAARELVRAHAPSTPVIGTVDAAVPVELLIDADVLARRAAQRRDSPRQLTLDEALREHDHDHTGPHGHLHDDYAAVTVETGRLDARATADLLADPPRGVYRTKGFVTAADGTRLEVHAVGRHVRTAPERGRRDGAASVLVFLGIGLDEEAVRTRVEGCSADPDAPADPQAVLSLLRYSAAAQSDSWILED
ncbi:GTP-binding protein [Tsukamurella asaccharolytica]|uniref:GTP-binding protein n=1 Tax=Tsukamurella asaccharolytica TaxID=2592067 RepID=A0A5C5RAB2_9ACTN|nr:CobW family GTP-binding protein [Tsukamurella asaccharolytica]TWS19404.1 GTP-binding protein [Tsukamurella asaccharolytica]